MEIKNAKYDAVDGRNVCINATIDGKTWSVPLDPDNTHYQAILEWAKIDANSIEAAD
tara:strand:+ start:395 stop:565 length:171 start_codon:yes stop_codon:yes gene_type:complete